MNTTSSPIEEVLRMPAPCPAPVGIACDGERLWFGSVETERIYAVDPKRGSILEEWSAPGTPYGITVVGDELRAIVGSALEDDRSIARFVVGHGFKSGTVPCPQHTGSHLAYDGEFLFLSQRFEKRILELEEDGRVRRTIPVPREVTGMTIVDGCFYLMTTESKVVDDYRLFRLDARANEPAFAEIASVGFVARGLTYDGARFWTNLRAENTVVAFARPDAS